MHQYLQENQSSLWNWNKMYKWTLWGNYAIMWPWGKTAEMNQSGFIQYKQCATQEPPSWKGRNKTWFLERNFPFTSASPGACRRAFPYGERGFLLMTTSSQGMKLERRASQTPAVRRSYPSTQGSSHHSSQPLTAPSPLPHPPSPSLHQGCIDMLKLPITSLTKIWICRVINFYARTACLNAEKGVFSQRKGLSG